MSDNIRVFSEVFREPWGKTGGYPLSDKRR